MKLRRTTVALAEVVSPRVLFTRRLKPALYIRMTIKGNG
jgi:hypothetical protein